MSGFLPFAQQIARAAGAVDGAPYQPRFGDVLAGAPGIAEELTGGCAAFVRGSGWQPSAFR